MYYSPIGLVVFPSKWSQTSFLCCKGICVTSVCVCVPRPCASVSMVIRVSEQLSNSVMTSSYLVEFCDYQRFLQTVLVFVVLKNMWVYTDKVRHFQKSLLKPGGGILVIYINYLVRSIIIPLGLSCQIGEVFILKNRNRYLPGVIYLSKNILGRFSSQVGCWFCNKSTWHIQFATLDMCTKYFLHKAYR